MKEAAQAVRWNIRPFIGGRYRDSSAQEPYDNINPATETVLCRYPAGNAADVNAAVRTARERFEDGSWSGLPPARRGEILVKLAELIRKHASELALLDTLEMGKPIQAARYDAEHLAPSLLSSWAGFADKLLGETAPLCGGTVSFNVYEPRGVIGAIAPWNFPCLNAIYKLGPALAAGNTLVLKPSELSPSSALKVAELALEAGVPEGVLNIVPGLGPTVGEPLVAHPDIDMVSFTGSTATGRRVMELCARSKSKPLMLECGGKSPQVVFDDIEDPDAVAAAIVQSVLWNQGQVCGSHTRLLVHERIKRDLLERVVSRAKTYKPSDPLDERTNFGPLASPTQRSRVKSYIEQGLRDGAEAVLKGEIREEGGCYVSPTIFDRVQPNMSIVQQEIFGPVLCVQTFASEQEALAHTNGTEYGLAATVWTRDAGRGRRMAQAIKAGAVFVRTSGKEGPDPGCELSFEPRKASGFGSERGLAGLQSYSALKWINFSGA